MADKVEWKCPKCGAPANDHGNGGAERCESGPNCMGFICECDEADSLTAGHGDTVDEPCSNAICYHCGWGGTFPPRPYKLTGWMKTAWDNGWRPPAGWVPPPKA